MNEQKLIKAPGGFARSACFIAGALFVIYDIIFPVLNSLSDFLRYADIVDFYISFSVSDYFIFAGMLLLFKQIKFLPVPFILLAWDKFENIIQRISDIINRIHYGETIGAYYILEIMVNLINIAVYLLIVLFIAFALIKKTRKATVLWFLPATLHFLGAFALGGYAMIDILPKIFTSGLDVLYKYTSLASLDLISGLALVFTGLYIRAYAKQKMHDEQAQQAN